MDRDTKEHGADGEYGKFIFAEKIVRPNADTIDFTGSYLCFGESRP
jgi:hypothetical protein